MTRPVSIAECADCMDFMSRYPDKFFDLAIVDPPYGIEITKFTKFKNKRGYNPDWDCKPPGPEYFTELFRVSRNQVIWGGNYFSGLPPARCFLIWDKKEGMYGRSFSECEYAWTSFSTPSRIYREYANFPNRIHPTQKPRALYSWILSRYAKPGDRVLDTHLGSGSSRIAAWYAGLDFYSCEIDPYYLADQEKRFRRECIGEVTTKDGTKIIQQSLF